MPGLSLSNKMDPLFDVVSSFAVLRYCAKNQLFRKNICTNDMLMNELLKMRLHYCGKVHVGLCDVCVGGCIIMYAPTVIHNIISQMNRLIGHIN